MKFRFLPEGVKKQEAEAGRVLKASSLTRPTGIWIEARSRNSCPECRTTLETQQYPRNPAEFPAGPAATTDPIKETAP